MTDIHATYDGHQHCIAMKESRKKSVSMDRPIKHSFGSDIPVTVRHRCSELPDLVASDRLRGSRGLKLLPHPSDGLPQDGRACRISHRGLLASVHDERVA